MAAMTFERIEKKYLLSALQYSALKDFLSTEMTADEHGEYAISNLYYDTDEFDLIRHSTSKPLYKEKLRVRSYGKASADSEVFIELKKKLDGVVYKRRAKMPYEQAKAFLGGYGYCGESQILREITYFLMMNDVSPKVYLYYDRKALRGIKDESFRITFDTNIRFRQSELRLDNGTWGTNLLRAGEVLMEVKAIGAMPVPFTRELSRLGIFPTSFSKYGTAYEHYILPELIPVREVEASA